MPETADRNALEAQADQRVADILRAASSWAKEAPPALQPGVRAVCIRLGEMVADQRNYLAPLPEPQESERRTVLSLVAERLAAKAVSTGVEKELQSLTEMELKSTGSWALVPSAQAEWITTAIRFLDTCAQPLRAEERPDPYWSEDVVAGIIASVRAVIGVDELHARTEARYSGGTRPVREEEDGEQ
jgi:hypothetical protein